MNLECLALYEKTLGKEHPEYARSLNNLALIYYHLGEYGKAVELNLECLSVMENIFGPGHHSYALILSNIAQAYSSLGDYDKALDYYEKALAIREEIGDKSCITISKIPTKISYCR